MWTPFMDVKRLCGFYREFLTDFSLDFQQGPRKALKNTVETSRFVEIFHLPEN